MRKSRRLISLAGLIVGLIVSVSTPTLATASPRVHHVFIISFDQGNPDLIATNHLSVFNSMALAGAHTWDAYTIVPSVTLPSHTSMLTGVGPQKHQILWNGYAPEKGLVKVPTIFSLAKERGFTTAMFVGKEKFKHLVLPGSLDLFVWPQPEDDAKAVAEAFASKVATLKPNLCFIHFRDPDSAGHKYGAYAPEKIQALENCDEALKLIKEAIAKAGILDDSVIILTADHGSHNSQDKNGRSVAAHGTAESADVRIPWVVWGKGVKTQFTVIKPVVQYDTTATALWLLGIRVPDDFWGRPITIAFECVVGST